MGSIWSAIVDFFSSIFTGKSTVTESSCSYKETCPRSGVNVSSAKSFQDELTLLYECKRQAENTDSEAEQCAAAVQDKFGAIVYNTTNGFKEVTAESYPYCVKELKAAFPEIRDCLCSCSNCSQEFCCISASSAAETYCSYYKR